MSDFTIDDGNQLEEYIFINGCVQVVFYEDPENNEIRNKFRSKLIEIGLKYATISKDIQPEFKSEELSFLFEAFHKGVSLSLDNLLEKHGLTDRFQAEYETKRQDSVDILDKIKFQIFFVKRNYYLFREEIRISNENNSVKEEIKRAIEDTTDPNKLLEEINKIAAEIREEQQRTENKIFCLNPCLNKKFKTQEEITNYSEQHPCGPFAWSGYCGLGFITSLAATHFAQGIVGIAAVSVTATSVGVLFLYSSLLNRSFFGAKRHIKENERLKNLHERFNEMITGIKKTIGSEVSEQPSAHIMEQQAVNVAKTVEKVERAVMKSVEEAKAKGLSEQIERDPIKDQSSEEEAAIDENQREKRLKRIRRQIAINRYKAAEAAAEATSGEEEKIEKAAASSAKRLGGKNKKRKSTQNQNKPKNKKNKSKRRNKKRKTQKKE